MQPLVNAVNELQAVPWRINRGVLVVMRGWAGNGLPKRPDLLFQTGLRLLSCWLMGLKRWGGARFAAPLVDFLKIVFGKTTPGGLIDHEAHLVAASTPVTLGARFAFVSDPPHA
jgi:hypothetical protein